MIESLSCFNLSIKSKSVSQRPIVMYNLTNMLLFLIIISKSKQVTVVQWLTLTSTTRETMVRVPTETFFFSFLQCIFVTVCCYYHYNITIMFFVSLIPKWHFSVIRKRNQPKVVLFANIKQSSYWHSTCFKSVLLATMIYEGPSLVSFMVFPKGALCSNLRFSLH